MRSLTQDRLIAVAFLLVMLLAAAAGASEKADVGQDRNAQFIEVKGLSADTEILIDRWGVPHIYASTSDDAFFSQGWNAARDRLWQIDMWRRSGLGELAAALGPAYVRQDRAIRLFTYRGDMEKEWAAYGADARRATERFVAGINAYVGAAKSGAVPMPVEFKLAGYEPAFWNVNDVVWVRNHGLAGNLVKQIIRAKLACKTESANAAGLLLRVSPPWTPIIPQGLDPCTIAPNVLEQYELARRAVALARDVASSAQQSASADLISPTQGSNGWVLAPAKTTTGRPILANDPHRDLEIPSLRYIAHLVAPDLNVIGAGEPALPGIVAGHNEHVAFGITAFSIAGEDLYVYETNQQDADEYKYRNAWEPMRIQRETIAVRGAADVQVELKFTRHGPVILEDRAKRRAYAIRAVWLDTGGAPYFGSMRYLRAKNMQQFSAALRHWGAPGENQVYADIKGNIGWFAAGLTPVRPNSDGLLPLPGDGRYEWNGYLDRDLLPSSINPSVGYIATANQMNLPTDYPYAQRRVGFNWHDDYRFRRISAVLDASPKLSIQDSKDLQNDYMSLVSHRLIAVLGSITIPDAELRRLVQWLEDWDGRVTVDSPQAALFEVWCARHLVSAVIARVAPEGVASIRTLTGTRVPAAILDLMERPDRRLGSDPEKVRDGLMLQTIAGALKETKKLLGADRSSWRWGKLATILFEHPFAPLAGEALLQKMNVGPAPKSGDGSVVSYAAYEAQDFRVEIGASFRMVLDVGQWDNSVAVNSPGQSGDPSSSHYRDLFPLWLEGEYFPLSYSRAAVEKAAVRRILLQPAGGRRSDTSTRRPTPRGPRSTASSLSSYHKLLGSPLH